MKQVQPSNNIPSLNGLRALSIFLVIFYHLSQHKFLPKSPILKYFGMIFFNGPLGVNVFFVISGYLITTLLMKENTKKGFISLTNFYARRMIRIFPAYYFLIIIYVILFNLNYFSINSWGWFSILTYTKQFFTFDINETAHLWSLSVEEIFYLIYPFIFIVAKKNLGNTLLFLIIVTAIGRFFLFQFPQPSLTNTIFTTADALLIGCYFAINNEIITKLINKKKWIIYLLPLTLISSIFLYNWFYHLCDKGNLTYSLKLLTSLFYSLFGDIGLITNLLIALILIISISYKSIWYKFLNCKIVVYIGSLSYSIYLWQQIFTSDRVYLHKIPICLILLIIFGSALLSYYLVEKPFLTLKAKYSSK